MALPASGPLNSIRYVTNRQYDDRYHLSKQYAREKFETAHSLCRKDLFAHFGCVNAIEFSSDGQLLVSGGDDRRVLVWRVQEAISSRLDPTTPIQDCFKPKAMRAQHISNIFCLGYDSTNSKIFSGGNDDQVIVHDARTGDPTDYFLHEKPVYGLSIDPLNDSVFASACDDGRILIFDIREPGTSESSCMASYAAAFHGVMFNPVEPRLLATANSKEGVALWDIRTPRTEVLRYGGANASQSCMSVRFNQRGTHILALRRRLPPVLYHTESQRLCAQFDHPGYYNSCTMKSCSFAGAHDEFVLSGSDDFNLYMWKIPALHKSGQWVSSAHMILKGHRSIVNQVRFNPTNSIIASSGVEKLIKFWSPFQLPDSIGGPSNANDETTDSRKVFSHEEYITLVLQSGQFMSHDYSHESMQEDPRMMAFFDSLVQREIEGWSSEESVHSGTSLQLGGSEQAEPLVAFSPSDSDSSGPDDNDAATAFVEALQARHRTESNKANEASSSQAGSSQANRITQLIAKKRAQLMRLARAKVNADQLAANSKKRQSTPLARFGTTTSSSSTSGDSSSSSEDWSFRAGTANSTFKMEKSKSNGMNGVKRRVRTSSSEDSDASLPLQQRKRKRIKVKKSSSSSSNNDETTRTKVKSDDSDSSSTTGNQPSSDLTPASVPNHNALKPSSTDENSLEEWVKADFSSRSKKCVATPDSGIDLSASIGNGSMSHPADSNDDCEKLLVFKKSCKNRFKRNYRNRATSDSDSD